MEIAGEGGGGGGGAEFPVCPGALWGKPTLWEWPEEEEEEEEGSRFARLHYSTNPYILWE